MLLLLKASRVVLLQDFRDTNPSTWNSRFCTGWQICQDQSKDPISKGKIPSFSCLPVTQHDKYICFQISNKNTGDLHI